MAITNLIVPYFEFITYWEASNDTRKRGFRERGALRSGIPTELQARKPLLR